jgi:predicted DNA-binding protein with PD1-like motif
MGKFIQILLLIVATNAAISQQIQTEMTNPTTPANDSKPNSAMVPDVYTVSGQFDRILILRFKYQTDLLAGLDSVVRQQKIQNAVILSGIGSIRNYNFHTVSNRTFPTKNIFVKDPTAPADILNMNGYVINGNVHAHVTFSNADKAFGGHLELGTNVFTFAIVTIGVFKDGIDLGRVDDKTYR